MEPSDVPDHLLLAVLLAGATRGSPVDVAQQVLLRADGDITRLSRKSIYESTPGVGPAGRARIGAATELARRIDYRRVAQSADPIMSPDQAAAILATVSVGPYEKLSALYLDRRHRPLGTRLVTVGNDSLTVVDPRQIFRYAMELGASSVILAHQHPSGDPSPSYQDIDVTKRVMSAGRILGIRLLDHLVIGNTGNWVSMATRGELPDWGPSDPMSITSR